MGKPRKIVEKQHSTDLMMLNVASSLVRDFQTDLNDLDFCSDLQRYHTTGDVAQIRGSEAAVVDGMAVPLYKRAYQIASLMKRYRFSDDIYSDQELADKAILGFRNTQDRLRLIDLNEMSLQSQIVLDLAASYIAKVLGEYTDEEHRNLSRFGRKASVGVPARKACLAERWELPISGSLDQIAWFDSEMSQDVDVQNYWAQQKGSDPEKRSTYQVVDSLTLALVPKTFKSLRAIMPNTTIGSYMSQGLGAMMRKRLKREGYDISTLQMRHQSLARSASCTGLSATTDLSSASDSITEALVRRLFPPDWVQILELSRIKKVVLPDDSECNSVTYCTMGIGYTFPLQTLVFLGLLKAIQALHFERLDRRTISVYGDDMIYATRMHEFVVRHFEEIGFVINLDKTFHEGNFRESCGGDYYHGVDVRPFSPKSGSALLGNKAYEAMLYKFINGLLMRWNEYEISWTLHYLAQEVQRVAAKIKLVPVDFPDDSGVKCSSSMVYKFLDHVRIAKPVSIGHGVYRFSYLRFITDLRKEERHEPYYWYTLRRRDGNDDDRSLFDHSHPSELVIPPTFCQSIINGLVGVEQESEYLLIQKEDIPIKMFRGITGHRFRRSSTYVTISHTGRYKRQSGTSCFEDRRVEA